MTKDMIVTFRAPDGFSPDPLTDLLRQGARDLIAQAVEAELNAFLAAHAGETDAFGRQRLVRHGHLPEREVQTGIGAVVVKVPRVRDRAPDGDGLKFTSAILPPLDLSRFRSGHLRAILAIKETGYGNDIQPRVQAGCNLHYDDQRPYETSDCV